MASPGIRWVSLLFCILSLGMTVKGQQDPHFDQITDEDGLPNGYVTSIYQDSIGFLWFGTANGLNRYDGYEFKTWLPVEGDSNSISHNNIWTLYSNNNGIIWVGTRKGLNRFDPATESFVRYFHDPAAPRSLNHNQILAICEDLEGHLWIGTSNGLCVKPKGADVFNRLFFYPQNPDDKSVRSIVRDEQGDIWFCLMDTLFCYQRAQKEFIRYPIPFSGRGADRSNNFVRTLFLEDNSYLWLGTQKNGVHRFDTQTQQFVSHYIHDPLNPNSLNNNRIHAFHKPDRENLWIGSYGGGLHILHTGRQQFHRFKPDSFRAVQQNFNMIWCLYQDRSGNTWMGTYYGGAKVVLKHKKPFVNYVKVPGKPGSLGATPVGRLRERADGSIWVPINQWGLALFDPKAQNFTRFAPQAKGDNQLRTVSASSVLEEKNGDLWAISYNNLWKMDGRSQQWRELNPSGGPSRDQWFIFQYQDRQGTHWIGTQGGLFRYDRTSNTLLRERLSPIQNGSRDVVRGLYESKNGDLWVARHGGLNFRKAGSKQFLFYPFQKQVHDVYQDQQGTLWVGTLAGLAFFDQEEKKVAFHPRARALAGKSILNILEDDQGRLWFSSNLGIIRFDPVTGMVREFNQKDGLTVNRFLGPYLKSRAGEFYFGGTKGLLRFHPDSIRENAFIPPVVLTNFQLYNRDVPISGSFGDTLAYPSPLPKNIAYIDTLVLQHWQNDFAFEFAALDFTASLNNRYRFMLEGYEKSWVETDASRRFARYTDLSPGDYTFRVIGSNNDGKWNETGTSVLILIRPPWWQTWWAYLLWSGLIMGALFLFIQYELRRRLVRAEARRLVELDAVKTRLYTNITHEFRTPLTVILGLTELLKEQVREEFQTGLSLIHRNGHQLLNLVNQMLDLSKLESGSVKLNMIQGNVIQYLRYLTESFHSMADKKGIHLHFRSQLSALSMDYEPERLQQVISNLLSNAVKFTPEGGEVSLSTDHKRGGLEIKVRDTGIGIPADMLPKVFDRFFQVEDHSTRRGAGTGIGLALAKELVQLMSGKISVDSQPGSGTTFTILLPITQAQEKTTSMVPEKSKLDPKSLLAASPKIAQQDKRQAPLVLIVEDNRDVVQYLITCLGAHYRIELAFDGQEGIEKALALTPDLIVSDVMMPRKDGFELCHTLKTDLRTSHIPIVLLTAKADRESKLTGLRQGADAYLAKPFYQEELETQIQNLLQLREKLQAHFLAKVDPQAKPQESQTAAGSLAQAMEHAFIQKVMALIEEDFGKQWEVPVLAEALHLSPSQLHRKLKALTDMHTTQFMRYVRLSRAAQLLITQPEATIAGIAYEVGFNSPSEFSRRFKKRFEMTPKAWRKHQKT
jgi:signal transduction histidine kinase/ligand-binding sensor domain-containing protein/CheY-like chemotaxis protein/AraC-like DNA-binding protein